MFQQEQTFSTNRLAQITAATGTAVSSNAPTTVVTGTVVRISVLTTAARGLARSVSTLFAAIGKGAKRARNVLMFRALGAVSNNAVKVVSTSHAQDAANKTVENLA